MDDKVKEAKSNVAGTIERTITVRHCTGPDLVAILVHPGPRVIEFVA